MLSLVPKLSIFHKVSFLFQFPIATYYLRKKSKSLVIYVHCEIYRQH